MSPSLDRDPTRARLDALVGHMQGLEASPEWAAALKGSLRKAIEHRGRRRREFARKGIVGGMAALAALLLWGVPAKMKLTPAAVSPVTETGAASRTNWLLAQRPGVAEIETDGGQIGRVEEAALERRVLLSEGRYRIHVIPQSETRPVVFQSPGLRVVVLGTRFDMTVTGEATTVELLEGRLRLEALDGLSVVLLEGSGTVRSDDARLRPKTPIGTPPMNLANAPDATSESKSIAKRVEPSAPLRKTSQVSALDACDALPAREQSRCLRHLAQGTGLSAQAALYTLGIHAERLPNRRNEAVTIFEELTRRFPGSAIAREGASRRADLIRRMCAPPEGKARRGRWQQLCAHGGAR